MQFISETEGGTFRLGPYVIAIATARDGRLQAFVATEPDETAADVRQAAAARRNGLTARRESGKLCRNPIDPEPGG